MLVTAPRINHLFFADDSLILIKASVQGARKLQHILELYEDASGQMINKEKTTTMFSPKTNEEVKNQMLAELGIVQIVRNDKYLGLPVYTRNSCAAFATRNVCYLYCNYCCGPSIFPI